MDLVRIDEEYEERMLAFEMDCNGGMVQVIFVCQSVHLENLCAHAHVACNIRQRST